jgi:hypothetical protein
VFTSSMSQALASNRQKTSSPIYNDDICLLISLLIISGHDSVPTGVTVILAFSVFMLAIAEKMPETSESIPLIGKECLIKHVLLFEDSEQVTYNN